MNILQLVFKIAIASGAFGLAFCVMMLLRNEWVFRKRCSLRGTPDYDRLPSYNEMVRRWWVWDIKKFL